MAVTDGIAALIGDYRQICETLVKAALKGASDQELISLLGNALWAVGVGVSLVEVACDAVDPKLTQHFLRWRRDAGRTDVAIRANDLFEDMLREDMTVLRFDARNEHFGVFARSGVTDGIAFADHLAPDVTLGFFDDVMSLFATEKAGGFRADDLELLTLVSPVFALVLGARLNAGAGRTLLRTYLGDDAASALLAGRVGLGEVEKIRAAVLYCDLAGFTSMTEMLDPQSLIECLNLFFELVTRPVAQAGGQVSGHVGDAVVMFFPISEATGDDREACTKAVRAAFDGLDSLNALKGDGIPLRARIGIDMGEVVHGNIGSTGRFSFTIIGTPVNRAARLQALAKDLEASMLMTATFAERAGIKLGSFGTHALRGFDLPVEVVGL